MSPSWVGVLGLLVLLDKSSWYNHTTTTLVLHSDTLTRTDVMKAVQLVVLVCCRR